MPTTPEYESVAQSVLIALTLAMDDGEEAAVEELRRANQEMIVDFLFGALLGTIQGWGLDAGADPRWIVQEMGRRSAKVFLGLNPDDEDEDD